MKTEQSDTTNQPLRVAPVSVSADLTPLFKRGDAVIIKGNLIGIILHGYLWTFMDAKKFLYRIIVDAKDCAYRIHSNHVDQTKDQDMFREDYDTLISETDQIVVMELFEEEIIKFER